MKPAIYTIIGSALLALSKSTGSKSVKDVMPTRYRKIEYYASVDIGIPRGIITGDDIETIEESLSNHHLQILDIIQRELHSTDEKIKISGLNKFITAIIVDDRSISNVMGDEELQLDLHGNIVEFIYNNENHFSIHLDGFINVSDYTNMDEKVENYINITQEFRKILNNTPYIVENSELVGFEYFDNAAEIPEPKRNSHGNRLRPS